MSEHNPVSESGSVWWWLGAGLFGLLLGASLSWLLPAAAVAPSTIPPWLIVPFALLLVSIALMPFLNRHFWERHYPGFAFLLGGVVAAYYLISFGAFGRAAIGHAAVEYFQFIALIGSLYLASGGVHIDVSGHGRPAINTLLLAGGAVLANVVGTTGASVLLIRPFLRLNRGRIRPIHVVMFIFIVSNCGGCLTPIGDPPLFLGYLRGVPFGWPLLNLWPMWLLVNGCLLALFFVLDRRLPSDSSESRVRLRIRGKRSIVILALVIASVLLDATLKQKLGFHQVPFGAFLQVVLAIASYKLADRESLRLNGFTFGPVLEVGLLFSGIFITMVPALGYLEQHAPELGIQSPSAFYFSTGVLSAVLDNAPTYLTFLQTAFGLCGLDLTAANMHVFLNGPLCTVAGAAVQGARELAAISMGAVFFGAMTYIGNGPNFMVKAIAERSGVKMPSFIGYLGYAAAILLPILVLNWAVFVR